MPVPTQHHCKACDISIESTDVKPHKQSQPHVDNSKHKNLYCHPCNKAFLDDGGFTDHNKSRHQPQHQHRNPSGRVFCVPCNVLVKPKDADNHRLLKKHIKKSKSKGFYCNICERAFMCKTGMQSHRTSSAHKANERNSGQRSAQVVTSIGGKFCEICGTEYSSKKKKHLRTQPHIDACKEQGLYCADCDSIFPTDSLLQSHSCPNHDPSIPIAARSTDELSLEQVINSYNAAGVRDFGVSLSA